MDHFIVDLGIMPWERIQEGRHGETSFDAYQYRMAKEMARMHKGGRKGDHHILVVIRDRDSGRQIDNAEVKVVAASRADTRKETAYP